MTECSDEEKEHLAAVAPRYAEVARLLALVADEWTGISEHFAKLELSTEAEKAGATARYFQTESERHEKIADTVRGIAVRAGATP